MTAHPIPVEPVTPLTRLNFSRQVVISALETGELGTFKNSIRRKHIHALYLRTDTQGIECKGFLQSLGIIAKVCASENPILLRWITPLHQS